MVINKFVYNFLKFARDPSEPSQARIVDAKII